MSKKGIYPQKSIYTILKELDEIFKNKTDKNRISEILNFYINSLYSVKEPYTGGNPLLKGKDVYINFIH